LCGGAWGEVVMFVWWGQGTHKGPHYSRTFAMGFPYLDPHSGPNDGNLVVILACASFDLVLVEDGVEDVEGVFEQLGEVELQLVELQGLGVALNVALVEDEIDRGRGGVGGLHVEVEGHPGVKEGGAAGLLDQGVCRDLFDPQLDGQRYVEAGQERLLTLAPDLLDGLAEGLPGEVGV